MAEFRFSIGDQVRSPPVGCCAVLSGAITERWSYVGQSFSGNYYNVRLRDGGLWCRDESELELA